MGTPRRHGMDHPTRPVELRTADGRRTGDRDTRVTRLVAPDSSVPDRPHPAAPGEAGAAFDSTSRARGVMRRLAATYRARRRANRAGQAPPKGRTADAVRGRDRSRD